MSWGSSEDDFSLPPYTPLSTQVYALTDPSGVLGEVMFLCRLMCFLLSGRLPFAMRLLPRYVVSAADLLSLSDSVSGARVICCSPSRLSYYAVVSAAPVPTRHSFLRVCKFGRVYSL